MKNYFALLLFASTLIGCETAVDIDVPLAEKRLVVNALNNPDSTWSVKLSLTRHVLDNSYTFEIPSATSVTITDVSTNSIVEQLKISMDDFWYRGSFKPEPEKEYLLKVVTAKYGTVQASGIIPAKVSIDKIEMDTSNLTANAVVPIKIHFIDPPQKKNYYRLSFFESGYFLDFRTKDTIQYSQPIYFEVDDPSLQSTINNSNQLIIEDTFFNGKSYVLAVKINSSIFRNGNPYRKSTALSVILSNLSEPYYRYATTKSLQQYSSGDPFAQPVLVYGNIENGLGIFGGYNQSVFVLKK